MGAMDYERRFGGIARLYGEAALDRFASSQICIIGIGGVGSWVAEALARSAVGALILIDLDHIAESNVNRQIHALEGQFGRAKTEAMQERIEAINPGCRVTSYDEFAGTENLGRLIHPDYDYVIDCIDAYKTKAAIIAHCRRGKIRVITAGGAGGQIDPLKITLADLSRTQQDPLLAKTRKLLRREYGFPTNLKRRFNVPCVYSSEQSRYPSVDGTTCLDKNSGIVNTGLNCGGFGSSMTVTATFGLVAVSYVLKKLARPS